MHVKSTLEYVQGVSAVVLMPDRSVHSQIGDSVAGPVMT